MRTLYTWLGVPPGARATALKERYRALSYDLHPDRGLEPVMACKDCGTRQDSVQREGNWDCRCGGGFADLFTTMTEAYNRLKDPAQRARYDAELKMLYAARICKPCKGSGVVTRHVSFLGREDYACSACKGEGYV